jgi:lysozyme
MKTSERGLEFLALEEGVILHTYRDAIGVLTIGVGHTAAAGPPKPILGMTIDKGQAFSILATDLEKFEKIVSDVLGDVPQNVFDGAVSFEFNTGAIARSSWPELFKEGQMTAAENHLLQWNRAGGHVLRGLTRRREAEADIIFRDKYPRGI